MRRLPLGVILLMLALPAGAGAHAGDPAPAAGALAAAIEKCPAGEPIEPDRVITGSFTSADQGSYLMLPFTVPDGTTAVRVKYCYDPPDSPALSQFRHTIDLGLYESRRGKRPWGPRELRGWGGSSHPDVTVSAEGFSKTKPGKTTPAFRPGPIEDGRWAVELGAAAVAGRELGDSDGAVNWRVEIELSENPEYADEPYVPAPYQRDPARRGAGWYLGDLHVHGEHSALNDAPMGEVFGYAFDTAKLDFLTLSDYVGGAHWDEIGRFQAARPDRLIVRSAEVITYRGHVNNHASATTIDHRTGPVFELGADGQARTLQRAAQPGSRVLRDIREAGGVTQLNHVTIFPNAVPGFGLLCRGCEWQYSAAETDYSLVDAIEVATGPAGLQDAPGQPGPNPFTATAVDFYERALAAGHHIAAVGSSDSHKAGRRNDTVTQSPIGQATTAVYASELSEEGVGCAIRAGHTYVKVWGPDRPDLRLEGRIPGADGPVAIFGDTIRAGSASFTARVLGGDPRYTLLVVRNGIVRSAHALADADETITFAADGPGRYGLRLMRGSSIEAVSTPVWVEDPAGRTPGVVKQTCPATKQGERSERAAARKRRVAHRRHSAALRRARRG